MIALSAAQLSFNTPGADAPRQTIFLSDNPGRPMPLRQREGFLVRDGEVPEGFGWYLLHGEATAVAARLANQRVVLLPPELDYLGDGDVVRLNPERTALRVLYRRSSPHNHFLLTERCNNYCLMCSQPPRNVNDGWIIDEVIEALPLIDRDTVELGITGGEPTLLGERFFDLVRSAKSFLPDTALHVLTNGRLFVNPVQAETLGKINHPDLMLGIPVYSDLAHVHDYVVQADGAYDETIRGILNLKRERQKVEIRVVLHKQTYARLPQLAEFIARNLLFADHVALMGLELMGFARANLEELWIDPVDYREELTAAVNILSRARMNVSLYNLQHCLLDRSLWPFARRSISDWKQEYMPECDGCELRTQCAGFFASAKYRYSDRITPLDGSGWPVRNQKAGG
ncbi:His-Xaa-Ser system radical SAM maturase HxsC [uncultured Phenylobacterium sp.]|uniref:His-Xaa-Ser system radical SAM maturase HxsC n=1 Tax=uncultured Phenylobacterium sp. TaxID=349273 RepID=UPI0025FB41C9|nr:His-Xaa-Ser system radical SAM maturase HxsC [uncultured Phenylobacterium sp.]